MNEFIETRINRQKDFNIKTKPLVDFSFNGLNKKIYHNVNLSIFVDDYCNADCKFCVAQLRYENVSKIYEKPRIEDDEEYYKRLDEVLTILEPLNVSVSITGGEPTASKRFKRIVELVNKHNIRKRTITTNGSLLLETIAGKRVIDILIENKIWPSKY